MPVTVTLTPIPPVQVVGTWQAPTTVTVNVLPKIKLVKQEDVGEINVDFAKTIRNTYLAGEVINGGKCLVIGGDGKAYHCNINDAMHHYKYIGIAENSASIGGEVRVISFGKAQVDFTVTPGAPYFISSNSFPVATPPDVGMCRQIGVGASNNTLLMGVFAEFVLI